MSKEPPQTSMYEFRGPLGTWARIWITTDGCFTTISDHGNYGYWWTSIGPPTFKQFLCQIDDDYLTKKLAGGEQEVDAKGTERLLREHIISQRRSGSLSKEDARNEWETIKSTDFDSESDRHYWYEHTVLESSSDYISYQSPIQVRQFVKILWPIFIEKLRKELSEQPY